MRRRVVAFLVVAMGSWALPGCIVEEMRDDVRQTRGRVQTIEEAVGELRETNRLLAKVSAQLATLDSLDASLKNLDVHLAGLRATIKSIDDSMPFLGLSSGADEPATSEAPAGKGGKEKGPPPLPTVNGVASYKPRIALPQNAILVVRLLDASTQPDAPVIIREHRQPTAGRQVPLKFAAPYDPAALRPGGKYLLDLIIEADAQVLWKTPAPTPVLEDGKTQKESLRLLLEQASAPQVPK